MEKKTPVGQAFLPALGERGAANADGQTRMSAPPKNPQLEITRGQLPHWRMEGSTYFVTFRLASGSLSGDELRLVLDHIKAGGEKFYHLIAATVMPDHVHVLLAPASGMTLSQIMKGIKGVSARMINRTRGTRGRLWQDESWDRIVRNQSELDEKLNYMLNNAVARGLVDDPWTYPGWYLNDRTDKNVCPTDGAGQ